MEPLKSSIPGIRKMMDCRLCKRPKVEKDGETCRECMENLERIAARRIMERSDAKVIDGGLQVVPMTKAVAENQTP